MRLLLVVGIACAIVACVAACGEKPPPFECAYLPGDMVTSVVGAQPGQVVSWWKYSHSSRRYCTYSVRFLANEATTNTHLLGNDDAIKVAPLGMVKGMREFELRRTE
jgi:hypothetical protein